MSSASDTQLRIKQTLDTDPEINFIPWELNIQDVAATKARNLHARGLLSLVLNKTQWDTHALNISIVDGNTVIASRFELPEFKEVDEEMTPSQITVARIKNKIRDEWMSAEQQLKLAIMDSIGETIRHIIAPPPMAFQNMSISDIIEAVRSTYGKTTRHTIKRIKEILSEKLDNVRNWRSHSAKMRNAFAISTTAGIIIDEYRRVEALRESIIGHHQMVTILKDYDHDYPDLHAHTFSHLTAYLELHLPNVMSHDDATKAHGLSTQIREKPGDDILLNMNAAQVTAYLALQDEVKKLRKNRSNRNKKSKRQNRKSEDDTTSDDESDRPKKKAAPRPEVYCWCHGTQKTHSSSECKVMAADPAEFTPAMRNATKSTSPPGGSTRMYGRKE